MRYLIILMLAACASEPTSTVQLRTPDQVECARQGTAFVKPLFPDAEYDERGVPKFGLNGNVYSAWAVVVDRCLKRSGAY